MAKEVKQFYFDNEDHTLNDSIAREKIDKVSSQINLIENADFAQDKNYWSLWNNKNYSDAEVNEIVTDENGKKWFHLRAQPGTRYQGLQQKAINYGFNRPLKKNTTYLISARIKAAEENSIAAVALHFIKRIPATGEENRDNGWQWAESKIVGKTEKKYSWTFTVPNIDCNIFNFMIGQWSVTKNTEEIWVTDISMQEVSDLFLTTEKSNPPINLISKDIMVLNALNEEGQEYSFNFQYFEQTTDFIAIKPSVSYTLASWVTLTAGYWDRVCWYDSSKNFVSTELMTNSNARGDFYQKRLIIAPYNAAYVRFAFRSYQDGVCALFEGDISDPQKPDWNIKSNSHPLDIYNPKSVAHRGYATIAPENTLPAFVEAKQRGFKFVECDLNFTSDNVCVLLADSTVNRTARQSDGTAIAIDNLNINTLTWEEVSALDFGIWKDNKYKGTKILDLKSFLLYCKKLNLFPYMELKQSFTKAQVESIINTIKNLGMEEEVTLNSFGYQVINYIKILCPSIRLGYYINSSPNWKNLLRQCQIWQTEKNAVILQVEKSLMDSEDSTYKLLLENNIPLEVWTIAQTGLQYGDFLDYNISGFLTEQDTYENYFNKQLGITKETNYSAKVSRYTLKENEFVDFGIKEGLNITCDKVGEYHFAFTSSDTPTRLVLPFSIQMPDDFEVEPWRRYEVNIFNGYGVVQSWQFIITVEESTSEPAYS